MNFARDGGIVKYTCSVGNGRTWAFTSVRVESLFIITCDMPRHVMSDCFADLRICRYFGGHKAANVSFRVPTDVVHVSRLACFARHDSVGDALADVNPGKRSKFIRVKNKIAKYIFISVLEMAALHYSSSSRHENVQKFKNNVTNTQSATVFRNSAMGLCHLKSYVEWEGVL